MWEQALGALLLAISSLSISHRTLQTAGKGTGGSGWSHRAGDAQPSTRAVPDAIDAKPTSVKSNVILERPARRIVRIEHRVDS